MDLIFIRIKFFSVRACVHVNENENGLVRARMDLDSNRKLVYEMVPIGSYWFLLMVRPGEIWYVQYVQR